MMIYHQNKSAPLSKCLQNLLGALKKKKIKVFYVNEILRSYFIEFCLNLCFSHYSQRDNEAKNADDVLFDMFRNQNTDLLPVGKFLAVSFDQSF